MLTTAAWLLLLGLALTIGAYIGARWAYGSLTISPDLARFACRPEADCPTDSSACDAAARAGAGSADGTRPAPSLPRPGAGRGSPKSHN